MLAGAEVVAGCLLKFPCYGRAALLRQSDYQQIESESSWYPCEKIYSDGIKIRATGGKPK